MEVFLFSGLVILLVISNAAWAWNTHLLLNKLMSRTYWEFQSAKQVPKDKKIELAEALANVKIPQKTGPNDLDSLDEIIKGALPFG